MTKQTQALPYPNYCSSIGIKNLVGEREKWIPNCVHTIQAFDINSSFKPNLSDYFTDQYVVIKKVRPELFLRRDFIEKFVLKDNVYMTSSTNRTTSEHAGNAGAADRKKVVSTSASNKDNVLFPNNQINMSHSYSLNCAGNAMLTLIMDEFVYHRFGLQSKRKVTDKSSNSVKHHVTIDLKDTRLLNSNKYHDKVVQALKRLCALDSVNFRTTDPAANEKALEFFTYVKHEYERDGFKPIPLSACRLVRSVVEKESELVLREKPNFCFNLEQLSEDKQEETAKQRASPADYQDDGASAKLDKYSSKPELKLKPEPKPKPEPEPKPKRLRQQLESNNGVSCGALWCGDGASLEQELITFVDWLGFHVNNIDCDREEISSIYQCLSKENETFCDDNNDKAHDANDDDCKDAQKCTIDYCQVSGYFTKADLARRLEKFFLAPGNSNDNAMEMSEIGSSPFSSSQQATGVVDGQVGGLQWQQQQQEQKLQGDDTSALTYYRVVILYRVGSCALSFSNHVGSDDITVLVRDMSDGASVASIAGRATSVRSNKLLLKLRTWTSQA